MLLIRDSGWSAFPERLPTQPVFYPVLNEEYAAHIAGRWNPDDAASGFAGFVTQFDVRESALAAWPEQQVGDDTARELWIPAEELPAFNAALTTPIRVVAAFYGDNFEGEWLPPVTP